MQDDTKLLKVLREFIDMLTTTTGVSTNEILIYKITKGSLMMHHGFTSMVNKDAD
jgi:hypothetical protein